MDLEVVGVATVKFDVVDLYLVEHNCVEHADVNSDVLKLDVVGRDVSEFVEIDSVMLTLVVSDA